MDYGLAGIPDPYLRAVYDVTATRYGAPRRCAGAADEPMHDEKTAACLIARVDRMRPELETTSEDSRGVPRPRAPVITFTRLTDIPPEVLIAHMSDQRIAKHMPLLNFTWDRNAAVKFVAAKEECWRRDGRGHWAILADGRYVGWGGFQKEAGEWDFGLVLKPDAFGLGARIARRALGVAKADARISFVTFLLPPSRRNLRALVRLGAIFVAETDHGGASFLKYRLETQ